MLDQPPQALVIKILKRGQRAQGAEPSLFTDLSIFTELRLFTELHRTTLNASREERRGFGSRRGAGAKLAFLGHCQGYRDAPPIPRKRGRGKAAGSEQRMFVRTQWK
mmetsp:Transcript_58738/g.130915  ORF Transcript_58738/g.130915 Transcript_58738/m.130915 type:complete len:107 (-) Transcript_58738:369-689(-)